MAVAFVHVGEPSLQIHAEDAHGHNGRKIGIALLAFTQEGFRLRAGFQFLLQLLVRDGLFEGHFQLHRQALEQFHLVGQPVSGGFAFGNAQQSPQFLLIKQGNQNFGAGPQLDR